MNRHTFLFFIFLFSTVYSKPAHKNFIESLPDNLRDKTAQKAPSLFLSPKSRKLKTVTTVRQDGIKEYSVIIHTDDVQSLRNRNIKVNAVMPGFVTAQVTEQEISELAQLETISYIDPGEINYEMNDVAAGVIGADVLHSGVVNSTNYYGQDVIVCIIDSGIDWSHLDFRQPGDTTQSRILYIWDQTITAVPEDGESPPSGYSTGVEYTQAHIEDEIDGSPAGFVREKDYNGHGTHVAGTAAGNGASFGDNKYAGMAPQADILVVKAGNYSFSTTNIVNGLTWAKQKATAAGKPLVVNISLGSYGGPHDGTDSKSVGIDYVSGAGVIVAASAGNAGSNSIHVSGTVPALSYTDITFSVPSYSTDLISGNDDIGFDLWFDNNPNITARVTSPNAYTSTRTIETSGIGYTDDGAIYINNKQYVGNSDREIEMYIFDDDSTKTPIPGTWTLRLTNNTGSSASFHGWLYDYNIGHPTTSTVSVAGGNTDYTLSNTADEAVIVASYVHRWRWSPYYVAGYSYTGTNYSDDISSFSSIGPTRTDAQKPDITAPGQGIISCLSMDIPNVFSSSDTALIVEGKKHILRQGTSMSSPVVTGAIALLLQQDNTLTPTETKTLLANGAKTDGYTGSVWNSSWGNGKMDIYKAVCNNSGLGYDVDREICSYDSWNGSSYIQLTGTNKLAVKFTPAMNGFVNGLLFHPSTTVSLTGALKCEIWSDNGSGAPGTKIGNTVNFPYSDILKYSWNYADMADSYARVQQGTDYYAVIELTNPGDNIFLRNDNGDATNRSFIYTSGSWAILSSYDLRLRPVVTQNGVLLEAKLFLQGPFDTDSDTMTTTLNASDLPATSPFADDARTINSVPANVTDWILLQLRETDTGDSVLCKSAFLNKDGRIVADDGVTGQVALNAPAGDYYLVIKSRNHLKIMSRPTLSLSETSSTLFNFTADSSYYYGTNSAKLLKPDIWGLFSGDINQDGEVTTSDYTTWYNNARIGASGYQTTDINFDGQVTTTDYTNWYNNARIGASSNVP